MRRPITNIRAALALTLAVPLIWTACSDSATDSLSGPETAPGVLPAQAADRAQAVAAQDRHTSALLAREDVVGTGVGMDDDGSYVIRVFTVQPGPRNLPEQLDGVPVRPVTTGLIVAGNVNDPTTKERPAPNGFSIGHPSITAGTLGALVKDGSGNLYALSNNHVLANSNNASIGDAALQPGPYDGGTAADQIGTLADYVPISFSGNNTVDAAIASVNPGDVTGTTPSYAYGAPGTSTTTASVGMGVQKFGRTTGYTSGTVAETNVTVDVCYETQGPFRCKRAARFVNQFTVIDGSFSAGGDSGSLIVTTGGGKNPVGLLYAGSSTRTIANPIGAVLSAFGVSITTDPGSGGGGGGTNTSPTADFDAPSCTVGVACTFDGSASDDPDGSIVSYAWTFGDGGNGSGVSASHTYGAADTYTATLTVTDNEGATGSTSRSVTVADAPPPPGGFTLSTTGYKQQGRNTIDLTWSGASGEQVDIRRNGTVVATTANDGFYTDNTGERGGRTYTYEVCEAGTSTCSNTSTVVF